MACTSGRHCLHMLRPFQAVGDIMDAKSVLKTDLQSPTPWWLPHWNKLYRKGEKRLHRSLSEKSRYFLHAPWIDDCKKEEFSWENWVFSRRCHVRALFYYLAPVSSSKSLPAVNTHIIARCLRSALKQHYFNIHSCIWEDIYQHCAQAKMKPPHLERCGSTLGTRKGCQGFDQ